LAALGLGTAGFTMQDVLLEPFGAQVLDLAVGETTQLTAILAGSTLLALAWSARSMGRGKDAINVAAIGLLIGVVAFSAVIFAGALASASLFKLGTALIGLGGGLFAVGMLTAAMEVAQQTSSGVALGAWGAVQATTAGLAIAIGGAVRDGVSRLAENGALGDVLAVPATGYSVVYHIEIALLFATMVALGPLVRRRTGTRPIQNETSLGFAEFPS
jgi:BCD family chlorophyll transporter-like MFS transporter